jgi:hypothetical protein
MPLDARYMHGMEVFNPHFNSKVKETLEIANKNNLLLSGGSDTHDLVVEHFAGMLVPSDINDQFELRDYLKTGENFIICEDGVLIENGKLLLDVKH